MVPEYDLARRVLWNLSFSVDKDSIQSNVWTIKWICTRTIQEVINNNIKKFNRNNLLSHQQTSYF